MAAPTEKVCSGCSALKPISEFQKRASSPDGHHQRCKTCKSAYRTANYPLAREAALASQKRWRDANPEKVLASVYRWKAANPDKVREYRRKNYVNNRERVLQLCREWQAANPDRMAEAWRRRRARLKDAEIGRTDLAELWESQRGLCALCGDPIDRDLKWPHPLSPSVDHIVPLSKGGTHEQANLQWTHLVENLRKGASVPGYWKDKDIGRAPQTPKSSGER